MGGIKYCKRWESEDADLSGLEVTKRILEGTMGGLEEYLKFTMETEEDFENTWLATLDTELKVDDKNIIMYRFYEKPTNPNTVLHFRTAMAEDSKIRSLTNEVIRRLLTTGEMIPDKDRCQILDRFAQKMKNSGYGLNQIRRVLLGGIKGYESMIRRCKKGERSLHRSSGESSALRASRKLTGKSEWFRKAGKPNDDSEEESSTIDKWLKAGKGGTAKQVQTEDTKGLETRTVLFVEQSKKGELARRLREVEKKVSRIVGYKTKIVEGVGTKLKDLMPNSNPWKGSHCGRERCIPCNQPTEHKQDCRRRNIIYENICLTCNPEAGSKVERLDGKELEDVKDFPSIYVGESGRSLHERALEHWRDFGARQTDSHILKHWMVHHHGQGTPNFHIRVIKYCKDALSRQVGEAVRISYRGQTLNSKNGYNRSGLSRLVIEEKEEEQLELPVSEEQPDPKGLSNMAGGWKTGKRDAGNPPLSQNSRKKRKLKYAVMEDDWGLGDGEDLRRMEDEELAKTAFLQAGSTDRKAGKLEKQTMIRTWSEAELMCRELILESISQSEKTGKFMSDLGDQLREMISSRGRKLVQKDGGSQEEHQLETEPEDPTPEGRISSGQGHIDGKISSGHKHVDGITKGQGANIKIKTKNLQNSIYATKKNNKTIKTKISKSKFTEGGPEDQGKKVSGQLSQPSPVLSPDDLSKPDYEINPEGRKVEDEVPEGRKHQGRRQETIKKMFAKKEHENVSRIENEILKEERLENKRRLEIKWKGMKIHAARLRWAKEWLEEKVVQPVIEAGYMKKIEEERLEAMDVSNDIIDRVMTEVKANHDCGYSTACPSWLCMKVVQGMRPRKVAEDWKQKQKKEIIPEGRKAMKREREPEVTRPKCWKEIENKVNLNVEPLINIKKFPRSPVKDLIHSFEQLANKNILEGNKHSGQNKIVIKTASFQKIPSNKIERSNIKPAVSISNRICNNMQLKPECSTIPTNEHTDKPTVKTGGFEDKTVKPNIPIGGKQKPLPARKVWTRLKSGLFGWKTLARPTIPSSGISAKTVSVFQTSQMNKLSKTRQDSPPKLIFFGGGGRGTFG